MAKKSGTEIAIPRRCGKQILRNNVKGSTPKTYYRRSLFLPFIDSLLQQLGDRFQGLTASAIQGLLLIPSNVQRLDSDKQEMLASFYAPDLPCPTTAVQEMQLWKRRWSHVHGNSTKSHTPSTLTESLGACNASLYPNINKIFRLLLIPGYSVLKPTLN